MIAFTRSRNVGVGVALVLLGGATLAATGSFPWDRPAATDAALFPRSIAALLIVIGLFLAVMAFIQALRGDQLPVEDAEGVPVEIEIPEELLADREPEGTDIRAGLLTAALIVAYCISAFTLGFVTSTLLFLIAGAIVLGHGRKWVQLALLTLFAGLLTAAYYVGFFVLLGVRAPNTLLP